MLAVPTLFRALVKPAVTVSAILLLWLAYTVLQTSFVMGYGSEPWMALLGFVPGTRGLGVLWAAGLSRRGRSYSFGLRYCPRCNWRCGRVGLDKDGVTQRTDGR